MESDCGAWNESLSSFVNVCLCYCVTRLLQNTLILLCILFLLYISFRHQTRCYQIRQVKILTYVLKKRSVPVFALQAVTEYLALLLRILQFLF